MIEIIDIKRENLLRNRPSVGRSWNHKEEREGEIWRTGRPEARPRGESRNSIAPSIGACILFTNGSRATDDKKIVAQHCSVPRKYRNVSQGSALHNAQRRVFEKGNGEEILISNYNESREEDGNLREGEENVYPRLVCVL